MALALYRKYRPRTFAEVIGQEHVTGPLSQALRTGRLHHAYLFSGPRGCGKTSSARILARSLNCVQGPTPEPCGVCESCVGLTTDVGSIDVIEIDAASHGGVDDARELRERAFFAPVSSRFKIYVIDEAHMVSSAGFNALLKLVEEPPEYVKFVFATTEPEKVLGTIKSRTHHYPFRLVPPGVLRPYLEQLCEREEVTVEPAVFPLVMRAGGGSVRDTLSVLDQLIAGAGPDGVGYARAVALLGVTDVALINEMCDALAAGDGAAAFVTVDRVVEAGHDPRRFASDLLERLRDLIVLKHVPDAATSGLLDAPADELARMQAQASQLGEATLSRCADIVHNGLVEMRGTTAPRLLLELICARMLLPAADDSTGGLLQRLERMERRLTLSGDRDRPSTGEVPSPAPAQPSAATAPPVTAPPVPSTSAPPVTAQPASVPPAPAPPTSVPQTHVAPAPVQASTPAQSPPSASPPSPPSPPVPQAAAGALDATAVRRAWDEILEMASRKKRAVAAWAREATVREVDGGTLILVFRYPFHAQSLSAQPEALLEAMSEVLGGSWEVRCEVGGDGRPAGAASGSGSRGNTGAGRSPGMDARPATGGRAQAAPAGDDWPRPAAPGGHPEGAASGGDWPQPAMPGNAAGDVQAQQHAPVTATATQPRAAATHSAANQPIASQPVAASASGPGAGRSAPGKSAGARGVPAARSGGIANRVSAANGAGTASQAGAARRRAGAAGAARSAGPNQRTSADQRTGAASAVGPAGADSRITGDGGWPGEPPYDPEFDASVSSAAYEGFDPGDEPMDEDGVAGGQAVRQTSEQQAIQLLQQAFDAEPIGEG